MIDSTILSKIQDKLELRWPRRSFTVAANSRTSLSVIFDTFATETEEKQIRNYVKKFMGIEYPNYQYVVERLPF